MGGIGENKMGSGGLACTDADTALNFPVSTHSASKLFEVASTLVT